MGKEHTMPSDCGLAYDVEAFEILAETPD
jgi:hypothetical protein